MATQIFGSRIEDGTIHPQDVGLFTSDAGGDDTYVGAFTPAIGAYVAGMLFLLRVATANTGACSFDAGPGAKAIKLNGSDPADGALPAGGIVMLAYNATSDRFDLIGSAVGGGGEVTTWTANHSAATYRLVNLGNPVDDQDATTKAWVVAAAAGLKSVETDVIKPAARVVSTSNETGTYNATGGSSGRGQLTGALPTTVDGVSLNDGDRILLTAQSANAVNGLWYRTGAATWDRDTTFNADADVVGGAIVPVVEGSVNKIATLWMMTTPAPTVGGVSGSAITFQQIHPHANSMGALTNNLTEKTTPVDADMLGVMDSAASNIWKKLSWSNIKATLKTYFDTLYSAAETVTTIGALVNGATAKTTPVDGDHVGLMDTEASNVLKKLSWANLKTRVTAQPYVNVYRSSNQSINSGAWAVVQFNAETYDADGMHNTGVNPQEINFANGSGKEGVWLVVCNVFWADNTSGGRGILLRGGTGTPSSSLAEVYESPNLSGDNGMMHQLATFIVVPAGGYNIDFQVYQNSGGALNVQAGAAYTYFAVIRIAS